MSETHRWDYHVETIGSSWRNVSDEELLSVLKELGQDGWEVFNVEPSQYSFKIRLVAKRPLAVSPSKSSSWL